MSSLCGCFGRKTNKIKDKRGNAPSLSDTKNQPQECYNVEISSRGGTAGEKWISFVKENGPIDVKSDESTTHVWKIEKWQDEPLWSFSQTLEDKKLYITHNMDDEVRMKHEDKGEKGLFTMLVQSDGGLLFRASDGSSNRYLCQSQNGVLEMRTTDNPTKDIRWYILQSSQELISVVQIQNHTESKQWLANGIEDYPVQQVQTSIVQKWDMIRMVRIPIPMGIEFYFRCGQCDVTDDLHFGSSKGLFCVVDTSTSGVKLQSFRTQEYIFGPANGTYLEYVEDISKATIWDIPVHRFKIKTTTDT